MPTPPPDEVPEAPEDDDTLSLYDFLDSTDDVLDMPADPTEEDGVPQPPILLPVDDGENPVLENETPAPPVLEVDAPEKDEEPSDCTFPEGQTLPSAISHADVPEITTNPQALTFGAQAILTSNSVPTFSAQTNDCIVTIRPELGNVNLRLGPGIAYEPPVAKTRGGVVYELVGASEPDNDNLRWFALKLGTTSAWVRSDLVNLSAGCSAFTFIDDADVVQDKPPVTSEKFPLPTKAAISQGYKSSHRGFDLNASEGSALVAPMDGLCIRRVNCTKCTSARPNRYPNASFQCPDTWTDPAWGFGYGNFIIVRHDYRLLPAELREEMDKRDLTGGFAYILYAHLSQVNVSLGQPFSKGAFLGATGNTGCSTAPHLHFEVRIGKDELVDNIWSLQRSVYPGLMFEV
ncbi:MAG: peptidoglycan DD-metalloendopeptidase family protein [Aggregatilineales bacterium]